MQWCAFSIEVRKTSALKHCHLLGGGQSASLDFRFRRHASREGAFESVKNTILSSYEELKDLSDEEIVSTRMEKYAEMGVYKE